MDKDRHEFKEENTHLKAEIERISKDLKQAIEENEKLSQEHFQREVELKGIVSRAELLEVCIAHVFFFLMFSRFIIKDEFSIVFLTLFNEQNIHK
jgi:uncharacterized membrane protein YgcG